MARELVLVPKIKYENLLAQLKSANQKGSGDEKPNNDALENEATTADDKKEEPQLYVEKPLSRMEFESKKKNEKQLVSKSAIKSKWTNYLI